jgi:hypothetical protein
VNLGVVSTLTPTLVNEVRFFFYRTINTQQDKTTVPGQQHPDFATGANFCCPLRGLTNRYQYIDNLTWANGTHSVKTAFNISYYPWFELFQQFHFGQYGDFTTPTTPKSFTVGFGPGQVTSKDNIKQQPFLEAVRETCRERETVMKQRTVLWRAQVGHDWRVKAIFEGHKLPVEGPYKPICMKPLMDRAKEGRVNRRGFPAHIAPPK